MSKPSLGRRTRRRALASLAAGAVAATALAATPTASQADEPADLQRADKSLLQTYKAGRYVVLLKAESATRYDGGTPGLAPTASDDSTFDAERDEVARYEAFLRKQQRKLAASVGADVDRHFTLASNGFTADLTGRQAERLADRKQVLLITEDEAYEADTWNTPSFLGLDGKRGVWKQHGGAKRAGDGVVIGVLDSGIWPESPSFAGEPLTEKPQGKWKLSRQGDDITMRKADGGVFRGHCEPGEEWEPSDCNSKIVGARYYSEAFENYVDPEDRSPTEVISTRDGGGHGSHTAGTAAGNHAVTATVEGTEFGAISGVAPAAKIAAYKVCFDDNDPNTGGCYTSATLAAIDDAIADGVDVINYSISGARDTVVDAVEVAFEGAAEAGIFIAASAGNSGPGASTVAHNSPWVTTVAASTHTVFENTLVLGDGTKINGSSIASALPTGKRLVAAADVKRDGVAAGDAALCLADTLDPAKAAGTIVVCDRGLIARVDKSVEVAAADGVGMVLANIGPGSLNAEFHSVPTVHIQSDDTPLVKDYLASAGATATASFERGDTTGGPVTPVPQMAGFSSRGPALASDSDVIKPDITAPGVNVLAAVAPPSNEGRDYDLYSGTSMSSPHVAGLAAFMLGVEPSWTPMMVKSAMMTTAYDVKDANGAPAQDPFGQGAGHVDPTRFFDPGLVITSDADDWRAFLQGQGLDMQVEPMAASDLNTPSIAQGQVTARTSISRTFTALDEGTWSISADLPGFTVDHPSTIRMKDEGDQEVVTFDFTRTTAPLGQFATGFVELRSLGDDDDDERSSNGKRSKRQAARADDDDDRELVVRIPVALRPVSVKAPAEVRGEGATGSVEVPIQAGFTGSLEVGTVGLAKGLSDEFTVAPGKYEAYGVPVSAGTRLARFDLDAVNDQADLDLYVYRMKADGSGLEALVGQSATGSADESVDLVNPRAATYYVVVDGYSAAPGESTIDYRFDAFRVDGAATLGDLAAEPNPVPVVTSTETSFQATWSGLDAGSRYLGWLEYEGALQPTYLYVDAGPAATG